MTKEEFLAADRVYQAACERRDRTYAALATGDRWGEARRFAGRAAGNRLAAIRKADAAWSRAYDAAEARWRRHEGVIFP